MGKAKKFAEREAKENAAFDARVAEDRKRIGEFADLACDDLKHLAMEEGNVPANRLAAQQDAAIGATAALIEHDYMLAEAKGQRR